MIAHGIGDRWKLIILAIGSLPFGKKILRFAHARNAAQGRDVLYSYLNATIGSTLVAAWAGT
jgi:hypothetical protein